MFKKILVPTDASQFSRRAFIVALDLAKILGAEVELFHVSHLSEVFMGYTVSYGVAISQSDLDKNGEIALDITMENLDITVPVTRKLKSGHPVSTIIEEIKEANIDLVVMGSHGYGVIAGSVMGSVSQRVLQRTECPVLIVK
ncbi:MAG: universal stress protein [Peptococcaceae bacterium]|jgi:nucleotide-binding universal stress UspA family protein|nr:universal stress protein [Peptococcaceae bacterium]